MPASSDSASSISEGVARFLVFFSSAAILVLEILAGRMMAPFAGVTLESFTAIIGTVLAGIALGSRLGGRAADTYDPRKLLGPLLGAGGILAIMSWPITQWLGPGLRGGGPLSVVALAAFAFFLPALVLSAVTPAVIKLRLGDLSETGTVVGRLSAYGTGGAIAGTFLTGFVLVANLSSRSIVLAIGLALVGTALWLAWRLRLAVGAVALLLAASAASWFVDNDCQVESAYSCIEVVEASDSGRLLLMDNVRHSFVDIEDPTYLEFRYARVFADAINTHTSGPQSALYIGGGGFTFPQWLTAERPNSANTVLELDPALVDLASERLGLTADETERIVVGDARLSVVEIEAGSIDLVVADAFGGLVTPWHLTTVEFNQDVKSTMRPDGVMIMNLIDQPPVAFGRAEVATLTSLFNSVLVVAPPEYFNDRAGGNYVIVTSDFELDAEALQQVLQQRGASEVVLAGTALADWVADARILTDVYAPVDQLITR